RLGCSFDFNADREHSWNLTVRTRLLQIPQRSTIVNPSIVPGDVQANSPVPNHSINLVLRPSVPPSTTPHEADRPPLRTRLDQGRSKENNHRPKKFSNVWIFPNAKTACRDGNARDGTVTCKPSLGYWRP